MLNDCGCKGECSQQHQSGCRRKAVIKVMLSKALKRQTWPGIGMCLACGYALVLTGKAIMTQWKLNA